jgi:hypothetical protein
MICNLVNSELQALTITDIKEKSHLCQIRPKSKF